MKRHKIVIFGIGNFFTRRQELFILDDIAAFIDNSVTLNHDKQFMGKDLRNPEQINEMDFDCIILASLSAGEMKVQLLKLGVSADKIIYFEDYLRTEYKDQIDILDVARIEKTRKKILFLSPILDNSGASVAMQNAARVFSEEYYVDIAVSQSDHINEQELTQKGIGILIIPNLYLFDFDSFTGIYEYDCIICNTSYMLRNYLILVKNMNAKLWLHDPYSYLKYHYEFLRAHGLRIEDTGGIYAVSEPVRKAFNDVCSQNLNTRLLPYGIPDVRKKHRINSKIVFAIIGILSERKGQDLFVKAVHNLPLDIQQLCEFWIIGEYAEQSKYYRELYKMAAEQKNIIIKGKLSKENMDLVYSQIDVVVSSSRNDPLPTVLTEGMMNQLIVIAPDVTGTAKYIEDGYNGFVFRSENIDMLSEKMEYIVRNFAQLDQVRENARSTYEANFTNKCFKKNLETIMKHC